jgi:hypothetical protein
MVNGGLLIIKLPHSRADGPGLASCSGGPEDMSQQTVYARDGKILPEHKCVGRSIQLIHKQVRIFIKLLKRVP